MNTRIMPSLQFIALVVLWCMLPFGGAHADDGIPLKRAVENAVKNGRLHQVGTPPFHLKATGRNTYGPAYKVEIEEWWSTPDKWKRVVHATGFDQTVVVNGAERFEQNSTDYMPQWVEDVLTATFEVAPQHSIDEVGTLNEMIRSGEGRHVNFNPTSTDGRVKFSWGGSVDLSPEGTLTGLFGTGFAVSFTNFQRFHSLNVARNVETFPPNPSDLITRVEVLQDLMAKDESVFELKQATPPDQRLMTVHMDEVEHRKLAVDPPEMKWAPVKKRPTIGLLSMYIVTDRTGKVREADFISSTNMGLKDSALELIRQWRFKPVLVDGVPVQVGSTMTFDFSAPLEGDQAQFEAASSYFKHGRDLTYPRVEGSPAFHMTGTFQWTGGNASARGTYEELWVDDEHWRREVTIGKNHFAESRLEDDFYREPIPRELAPLVQRVFSLYAADFPGFAYYSPDTDWQMARMEFEGTPVVRVTMGASHTLAEWEYERAYYFDEKGLVRARTQSFENIGYSEFSPWAGKQVPRRIESKLRGAVLMSAHIDALESAEPKEDSYFRLNVPKGKERIRPW